MDTTPHRPSVAAGCEPRAGLGEMSSRKLRDIASGGGSEGDGDGDVGGANGGGQHFHARDLGYVGWRDAMIGTMGSAVGAGAVAGGAAGPGAGGVVARPRLSGRLGARARVIVVS